MKISAFKLLFSLLGLFGLFFGTVGATTIVGFNFENSAGRAAVTDNATFSIPGYKADLGITGNINSSKISVVGPSFGARSSAGTSSTNHIYFNYRDNGSGAKYWQINFSTEGYSGLTLFSKQKSPNTGPRDFKVEYSIGGDWFDFPGNNITVLNDNWVNGVLNGISLPSLLNNKSNVSLRWIMTSNTSVDGGTIAPTGTNRIDDIIVEGTINQYTVTFRDYDNTFISSGSVNHGSSATAPSNPGRTGYTFSGWDAPYDNITGATTITAQYNVDQYLVTFQDYNGTLLSTELVNYSSGATAPVNPTRTGYTFSGWDVPYDNITGATTITAQYNINNYTVTYTAGANGTISGSGTQVIDYGSDASAITAIADTGYGFSGWSDGSVANPRTDSNVTGNIFVTANFAVNQYSLTFNAAGGTSVATISGDYNTAVTAPVNPTRTGYTFSGWDIPVPATIPAMNTTYTAQWNVNQYTLTFDTNSGSLISPITGDYGTPLSVTPPTRSGYTFAGWLPTLPATIPAANTTYIAQWTVISTGGPATGSTSGGGGGGYTLSQDSCPDGDKSPSYYDGLCEGNNTNIIDPTIFNPSLKNTCFTPINKKTIDQNNNVSQAFKVAHQMLYSYGLTTWKGTQDYRPYDYLTRAEAAKFMVEFADNVLCRTTTRTYDNNFSDIGSTNATLIPFIQKAYEYNIFNGDHTDASSDISTTFRPTDRINNDELTAIMIRLVTNSILEESLGGNWAEPYMTKLNQYTTTSSLDTTGRGNIAEVIYDVYRNNTYTSQSGGYVIQ